MSDGKDGKGHARRRGNEGETMKPEKTYRGVRSDKAGRLFIDYHANGRRHREWGFRNKSEAADALATRKAEILCNRFGWESKLPSLPFADLLDWYLTHYSPEKRSHKRDLVSAKPLRAAFGSKTVAEITTTDVQAYKITRRKTEVQPCPKVRAASKSEGLS